MMDTSALKSKLQELENRTWDREAIIARCKNLSARGIPAKNLIRDSIAINSPEILDRVQRKAEEYNYVLMNCAQSTALAVMEEFGLGTMDVLKALSPLPGCGGTGWTCGAVSGGLASLGLFAGDDSLLNVENAGRVMMLARDFMDRFQQEFGSVICSHIQEETIFGRYLDPGASPENMRAFEEAKGFERCSLVPGIGARIVSEIILKQIAAS